MGAVESVVMRSVDLSRRRYRHYHLMLCESLFGKPAILVAWGRVGTPPRVRLETFDNSEARMERWSELTGRRTAHGYQVVANA